MAMEAPEALSESEEVASNSGFKRGLSAGRAAASKDSANSGGGVSTPSLNDDQDMTWELLMILGIVLLLISPVGEWLAGVVREITTHHNMNLDLNPLDAVNPFAPKTSVQSGTGINTGGGSSNAGIGHFTVNLAGGGQMNVNASSPQAAVENVKAEGGTPA